MHRLRRHYRTTADRFWLLAFARHPHLDDAYELPPGFGQYLCGYAIAYQQAGATVYDEVVMQALLAEAQALASPAGS